MKTASLRRTPFAFLPRLRARHWAAQALALGCASCNFAPAYRPPPVAVPAAFKEGQPPSAGPAETWEPAKPGDAAARGAWWERYGDPVLNSLEEQVRVSNQTILGAAANFRNSRALAMEARASLFPTATGSASVSIPRPRRRAGRTPNASQRGERCFRASQQLPELRLNGEASFDASKSTTSPTRSSPRNVTRS